MADETYHPRGVHPMPDAGSGGSVTLFGSIDLPGYLSGDIAIVGDSIYRWDGTTWNALSISGGGGADPEVFAIAGAGTPGAAPVSGAGVAYNAVGNLWVYSGGAWVQQF